MQQFDLWDQSLTLQLSFIGLRNGKPLDLLADRVKPLLHFRNVHETPYGETWSVELKFDCSISINWSVEWDNK